MVGRDVRLFLGGGVGGGVGSAFRLRLVGTGADAGLMMICTLLFLGARVTLAVLAATVVDLRRADERRFVESLGTAMVSSCCHTERVVALSGGGVFGVVGVGGEDIEVAVGASESSLIELVEEDMRAEPVCVPMYVCMYMYKVGWMTWYRERYALKRGDSLRLADVKE